MQILIFVSISMYFPEGKGRRVCMHPGHQEQLESEDSKAQAQWQAQALCPLQSWRGAGWRDLLGKLMQFVKAGRWWLGEGKLVTAQAEALRWH